MPRKFLESELPERDPQDCLFHIIPVPLEASVSYGAGTAEGPGAILAASQQLELYDGHSYPYEEGIHTRAPIECTCPIENLLQIISTLADEILADDKIPVLLGGEHTVSTAMIDAVQDPSQIGIVQFDAHADLRATYQDSAYSHACVLRRFFEKKFPIQQIGVRSLSREEVDLRRDNDIAHLDAEEMARNGLPDRILAANFPEKIYLTIDVDVLDPSIMPATGTPEPGGLDWHQLFFALENVIKDRQVVGFDIVEFAPIAGLHHPDFTSARLIYNLMGLISRNRK